MLIFKNIYRGHISLGELQSEMTASASNSTNPSGFTDLGTCIIKVLGVAVQVLSEL